MQRPAWALSLVLALGAYSVACIEAPARPLTADQVLESETVIEGLRGNLAKLSKSVMNLSFPDAQSYGVFEPKVEFSDLASGPPTEWTSPLGLAVREAHWEILADARAADREELDLWRSFLSDVEFFHHFSFYNVRGRFHDSAHSLYETDTGFKGLAQLRSGKLAALKGKAKLLWHEQSPRSEDAKPDWLVQKLELEDFHLWETERPMFADVLHAALDTDDLARLLPSVAEKVALDGVLAVKSGEVSIEEIIARQRARPLKRQHAYPRVNQIAVVDIDRDGFDDFYFTATDAPAYFFRSRGDGTFEEISEELGLRRERVHGSVFADFDNDGDADAFLTYYTRLEDGEALEATVFMRNDDGRFVEANDQVALPLRGWTLPMSVADYDNDGLLDVFLARYAAPFATEIGARIEDARSEGRSFETEPVFMSAREWEELVRRLQAPGVNPVWNRPGPPNLLLKNMGEGRFARAPSSAPLETYYNTLASAWSDYDRDGDMDLYVTNELGPNHLFTNRGDGTFEDVSNAVTGEVGWGMGASWGDYDGDGRPDMYVTNMYTKAGMRIAEQMQSSSSLVKSARGNTLMRNGIEGFTQASGLEPPAALVEAADFSWGGGFGDLNNDGVLDIYVPNGGVTAPKEVATVADL